MWMGTVMNCNGWSDFSGEQDHFKDRNDDEINHGTIIIHRTKLSDWLRLLSSRSSLINPFMTEAAII